MADSQAVTCQIRYTLNLAQLGVFKTYAQTWISLIERYGGIHHGYFIPRVNPDEVGASFPGSATMAQPMSPSRCSLFQMKRAIGSIATGWQPIQNVYRPPLSSGRPVASLAMNAFSWSR